MTARRSRLAKLETKARQAFGVQAVGRFDADPVAGVWREVAGGQGREFPLSPDDLEVNGEQFTVAALHLSSRGAKIYGGVTWGDL